MVSGSLCGLQHEMHEDSWANSSVWHERTTAATCWFPPLLVGIPPATLLRIAGAKRLLLMIAETLSLCLSGNRNASGLRSSCS